MAAAPMLNGAELTSSRTAFLSPGAQEESFSLPFTRLPSLTESQCAQDYT